ncbi:MAG TPA: urease subunit beta [Egibacteraceae bacterium]|nr:urease subunit beta [Egibacteraceae bacterium]
MHLDPTEHERLLIFSAAQLARRNLGDGVALSAAEAIAIVCDEMHRAARRGGDYADVLEAGRTAVDPTAVLDGVAALVPEIRLEVLLDEGTRLVVLAAPFGEPEQPTLRLDASPVEINPGTRAVQLRVRNTSTRPVRVSSHYPFWKANPRLEFDRDAARGRRLDLPAGDSLRWGPGDVIDVDLIRYGGEDNP